MSKTGPETYVGIDYSMNSPGVCIHQPDVHKTTCIAFIDGWRDVDQVKVSDVDHGEWAFYVYPNPTKESRNQIERYNKLATLVVSSFDNNKVAAIGLEDYSMASRGKVFHIAENTAILKYHLFDIGYVVLTVAPTTVKKFACGTGRGTKDDMYDSFVEDTKIDLMKLFGVKRKLGSPITDMIDAYYIAKYALSLDVLRAY